MSTKVRTAYRALHSTRPTKTPTRQGEPVTATDEHRYPPRCRGCGQPIQHPQRNWFCDFPCVQLWQERHQARDDVEAAP
jgi:hypothetical protein